MNVVGVLQEIGLSEKAARIYGFLLQGGVHSAHDIAKATTVCRPTVYDILEQLQSFGVLSVTERGGRRVFSALSPDSLRHMMEHEGNALHLRRTRLEEVLPFLQNIHEHTAGHPRLYLYEGTEGLRRVRQTFLETHGDVVQIVPLSLVARFDQILQNRLEHVQKMTVRGSYRGIAVVEALSDDVPTVPGGEVRVLTQKDLPLQTEITVRGDRVFFFSYTQSVVAIMIENAGVAEAVRGLFSLAWMGVPCWQGLK